MITKQERCNTAVYCRLSQDDGQVGESGSIETQRALLTQYCQANGFHITDYYCDDGWSGTNFQRPEFQRMLADIETGKINLVLVKDLSRFGREYAQMGLYIEHYFDENNIRFIAVGENIDTINGMDNVLMPITNVINSLYARDCSRKTKAAHRARAQAGMYIGGHAPFGYIKDPNDRHRLIVDPDAADVVRKVFNMFADGIGYVRTTKLLREQGILNPQAHFNQNNPDYYKGDYWRKPFDWHATSIRVILTNRVYLGQLVFGKTKCKGTYNKKRVPAPEDEWIVVENTHEPLVSQELWDTVQKMIAAKRRETKQGEIQLFSGLVKCSDCGSSLNVSYNTKRQKYTGFSCWVYKNYGKQRCTSHAIGWKALNELVLDDIRRQARIVTNHKQQYFDMLSQANAAKLKKDIDKSRRELKRVDKRVKELDVIISKLFEENALGKISEERYNTMSNRYELEQTEFLGRKQVLETEISKADEVHENTHNFISLIGSYTDVEELDTRTLNELIDRIVVHEKVINVDGQKSQQVDIHYKFVGMIPVEIDLAWLMQKTSADEDFKTLIDGHVEIVVKSENELLDIDASCELLTQEAI